MFAHKLSESLEGLVRFDDIALPVFRQVLKFIYTGRCDMGTQSADSDSSMSKEGTKQEKSSKDEKSDDDIVPQLLAAADRFQLADLHMVCSQALIERISPQNVADLLMIAGTCHATVLKVVSVFRVRLPLSCRVAESCVGLCEAGQQANGGGDGHGRISAVKPFAIARSDGRACARHNLGRNGRAMVSSSIVLW